MQDTIQPITDQDKILFEVHSKQTDSASAREGIQVNSHISGMRPPRLFGDDPGTSRKA